jgi:hypothetical protein
VLAHASTTRLYLKKGAQRRAAACRWLGLALNPSSADASPSVRCAGKGENRICKVVCSPHMPEAEGVYSITDGGIAPEKD